MNKTILLLMLAAIIAMALYSPRLYHTGYKKGWQEGVVIKCGVNRNKFK